MVYHIDIHVIHKCRFLPPRCLPHHLVCNNKLKNFGYFCTTIHCQVASKWLWAVIGEWRVVVHKFRGARIRGAFQLPPRSLTKIAPEKLPKPNRKGKRLPTTIFQGRAVKLRGCM